MLLEQFRNIKNQLDTIRFIGLSDYYMGTALTVQVCDVLLAYKEWINIFKRLIVSLFFKQYFYNVEIQPEAKILFLFSHSYADREDLKKTFNKVTNLLKTKDALIAGKGQHVFDARGFIVLAYLPIWLIQMRKIKMCLRNKLYLAIYMAVSKKWISSVEKIVSPRKYNLLVTFCDIHLADNILTQYLKKAGVTTATLQHGWYRKTLGDADSFSNIELGFEGFISDKFLLWGEYARTTAIQSGISSKSIICTGYPKFIGYQATTPNDAANKFGIILGRSRGHCLQENKALIKIANSISKEFGLQYIVKYHPGDSVQQISEYDNLLDQDYLYVKYGKDTSLETYIKNVEFSIVGSSSVYADLLYIGEIAFYYTFFNDDYDAVEWGKFKSKDDAFNLIRAYQQDKEYIRYSAKEIGQLLCGKGDIAENYKAFFRNYM